MEAKSIKQMAKNLGGVISKNSPTILTSVAVAGLVTTTIFAVKATPKALALIEAEERKEVLLSKKDIMAITWKCYVPTGIMGLITIVCIISAHNISLRRSAALASAYTLTETAFKEYQAKIVETIGKNKELKVRDEIVADHIKNNPVGSNEIFITGKGEILCYDSLSGRYFKSDIEQIRRIVNNLNRDLLSEMFLSVNDLYYAIGLSPTRLGDELGWNLDNGLVEISFSTQLTEENEPCLVLNYDVMPKFI